MAEELTKFAKALPANIEDLYAFVFVGREKLVALQAELRAMTKVGTETAWFARMVQSAKALVFHFGRMRFDCPTKENQQTSAAMQGQVFVYFGPTAEKFL